MRVAVIPARGGSKRIPKKNIKLFCGKPIIAYSIEAAQRTQLFDEVIVSTDDAEIADVANRYGAATPFIRPASLADDYTGTNAVIRHSLEWYQQQGKHVEFVCCIYATAPFVRPEYLVEGFEKLSGSNNKFAFSVTTFPFPIQRAIRINEQGTIEPFQKADVLKRSQDLEEAYHDAGQFYWGRAEAFINDEKLFSEASIPVVLPRYLVQDIDTLEDWVRAEFMYQAVQMAKGSGI